MPQKWIQSAHNPRMKGALHKQLGIPLGRKIPKSKLHKIIDTKVGGKIGKRTVTKLMKQRAIFALNAQKRKR